MKKFIVLALMMVGTTVIAQERGAKHQEKEKERFSIEQRSQLMLKKMTLALDLNETQQKEMGVMISDKIAKMESHKNMMNADKKNGVRPTNDERFAMKMQLLNAQIATKKRLEKILTAKQFEKWAVLKEDHQEHRKGKFGGKPERKRQG